LNDAVPINYERFRMYEVIMGNISGNFFGGVGVNFESYWNITKTFTSTDSSTYYNIDKYGFPSAYVSSGISLNLQFDDRTNSNNPSKGSFLYVQYIDNLKLLGSTSNWQSLMIDARHYIQLPYKSHNVLALWSFNWLTVSGHPPYMNLPATGEDTYNNTARGYVEGRFRGLNMLYAEAEYRFRILRNGF